MLVEGFSQSLDGSMAREERYEVPIAVLAREVRGVVLRIVGGGE